MLDSLYNRYDQVIHQKDKINKALSFLAFGAKVDAIIYVGMFDRDISEILSNIDKPIIIAYSTSGDEFTCSVSYENENAAAELTKYVVDNGHKQIAIITGIAHTAPAQERLKGINRVLEESGLVSDNVYIKNGDWERASGYACMKDLLASHSDALPTAVLAMNDLMAIGAMDAVRDSGLRIPEDISVVGFDNREVSEYVYPKLTTVEIDLKSIGYTAAQMATQKLIGYGEYADKRNVIVPSKLQVRDTVAVIK
jgi:LacI family transcriptional regulator